MRRFESFSLKISNKTMVFLFTTRIHHNTGSPGQNNQERKRKETKGIKIKEELKMFLLADDMILYIENSRKLLRVNQQIQQNCKIKIYIQKSVVLIYDNNILSEKEVTFKFHL